MDSNLVMEALAVSDKIKAPPRIPEPEEMLFEKLYHALSIKKHRNGEVKDDSDFTRNISRLSSLPNTYPLVEIACGLGHRAYSIARQTSRQVIGIDKSPKAIEYARTQFQAKCPNLTFMEGDVYNLAESSLPEAAVVSCIQSLHHFDDLGTAIENLVSIMHPDGLLYIQDFDRQVGYRELMSLKKHRERLICLEGILKRPKEEQEHYLARRGFLTDTMTLTYISVLASHMEEEVVNELRKNQLRTLSTPDESMMSFRLVAARPTAPYFQKQ